jgi:dihydroneopterin aldolase
MEHNSSIQTPDQASQLMLRVALQDVRFFAYHGFYPEEQVVGNEFFVDVSVWFPYSESTSDEGEGESKDEDLDRSVNYEILYRVVKEEMEVPRKLLETAAYDIFERLQLNFSNLVRIEVRIRKTNPPFGGDSATALVEVNWSK